MFLAKYRTCVQYVGTYVRPWDNINCFSADHLKASTYFFLIQEFYTLKDGFMKVIVSTQCIPIIYIFSFMLIALAHV
jgi:hypothetical protein